MTTDVVVKVLAVVGSAVLGGVGLGLLSQLLSRAFTAKPLHRWPLVVFRLLGAAVCGWLVAWWLFDGGGSGIGGSGGWGFGSGSGSGETDKPKETVKTDNAGKKDTSTAIPDADKLRVEVLVKGFLEKLGSDEAHCYRVHDEGKAKLLTREEVEKFILSQQEKQPSLRCIEIVLYKEDSPDKDNRVVASLESWAAKQKVTGGGTMKVDIVQRDADAPGK
jgi:hypothetical protein